MTIESQLRVTLKHALVALDAARVERSSVSASPQQRDLIEQSLALCSAAVLELMQQLIGAQRCPAPVPIER